MSENFSDTVIKTLVIYYIIYYINLVWVRERHISLVTDESSRKKWLKKHITHSFLFIHSVKEGFSIISYNHS